MNSKKYNIIIVDDHKIFRDGFKLALKLVENAQYIGEAVNGEEFLKLIEKVTPDIVFIDVNMPVMNGYDAVARSLKKNPQIKFIALTSAVELKAIKKMIMAGVEGYMLKNAEIDEISKAINRIMEGKNYFSEEVLYQLTRNAIHDPSEENLSPEQVDLSEREKEVLSLLCEGKSVIEISEDLHISYRTVEKHKEKLMSKSQTKNTVNLILWALRHKFVEI